ncbi:DUF1311 domain-containing protein [Pararobbsia alpina]
MLAFVPCTGSLAAPASSGPTMIEMQQTAVEKLAKAQHQLQTLIGELDKTLPPDSVSDFHSNQHEWSTLTQRECAWQRELSGGSMAPLMYTSCLEARTRQRINWLKLFLCEGYGSTGECDASKRY